MPFLADAFQPRFVQGLNAVTGRPAAPSISELIGAANKKGYDLYFDNSENIIRTDFRDFNIISQAVAYDASRFASASFQSLEEISKFLLSREHLPWGLIKIYYAAYYAGHAIIRLTGESCSYLDRAHVNYIIDLGAAQNIHRTFPINATSYHCKIIPNTAMIESKVLRGGGGGAHDAFWDVLAQKFGSVADSSLRGTMSITAGRAAFAKLEKIRERMRKNGTSSSGWLSLVRNEIQYKHEHGLWIPPKIRGSNRESLNRAFFQWTRSPDDIDIENSSNNQLEVFTISCAFIISLCRDLLERIADRSESKAKSFAKQGPLALISKPAVESV